MRESITRLSFSHTNLSKLVNLLTSALFFHRCTQSSSLITLSCPSFASHLIIANRIYYHSASVLWNSLPSDLRHVAHHVNPSPIINSRVSDLSTSLFFKVINPSLSLFLSSFIYIHLGYLRTDISGIDHASLFHLTRISLSFSVISFMPICI